MRLGLCFRPVGEVGDVADFAARASLTGVRQISRITGIISGRRLVFLLM